MIVGTRSLEFSAPRLACHPPPQESESRNAARERPDQKMQIPGSRATPLRKRPRLHVIRASYYTRFHRAEVARKFCLLRFAKRGGILLSLVRRTHFVPLLMSNNCRHNPLSSTMASSLCWLCHSFSNCSTFSGSVQMSASDAAF